MFDCHTHVQFEAFKGDWKEAIARAQDAGVSIINVGTQKDTSTKAVEVARLYPAGVYAAIGLHPVHTTKSFHDEAELGGGPAAKAFTSRGEEFDYDFYRQLAADPKVVALGECGLDYYRTATENSELRTEKEKQKQVFLQHVKIAEETGKALMIHCRPSKGTDDAYDDLLGIIQANGLDASRAVLHFYVGSVAMTKKFLDAGFNFEFGGVITFARDYDEQIRMIPIDRILTETDAPYVSPAPYRGQRNEPAYVIEVVKKLAEIKGISYDEMARATDANARRIFKI
jgi:TatD DNase family protein